MAILAYKNRALGTGAFSAVTGTWTTNPPISHLGSLQVPTPHAEATPAAGELEFTFQAQDSEGDPENMTVDVFAILAHTLPDNAVVTFSDDSTELAQITYSAGANLASPAIVVAVLSAPVTLDTITVNITSAGSSAVNIGAFWVSRSFRVDMSLNDYNPVVSPFDNVPKVDAVPWPNARSRVETIDVRFPMLTEAQARGPGLVNWRDISRQIGYSEPIIVIPTADDYQYAHYGLITSFGGNNPTRREFWSASFTMMTML